MRKAYLKEDTIPKPVGLGSASKSCSALVQTLFNEPFNFNCCSNRSRFSSSEGCNG